MSSRSIAERERIAREMHDGLAQVLGYVNTKSQAIEELLVAGRTDEARGPARRARGRRPVDLRRRPRGHPRACAVRSSPASASWPRSRTTRPASPRPPRSPSASSAPDAARRLELAPDVEAQVFRIVQEALTNVRKHSGAGRAEVDFSTHDDGSRSSSPTTATENEARTPSADRPRYGLRSMRERADSIGATIEWASPTDGGWRVHLALPDRHAGPGRSGGGLMRIVLADDHALFRDGVSSLVQAWGHEVVGHAAYGGEAVDLVTRLRSGSRADGCPDAGDVRRRGDRGDRRGSDPRHPS